MFDAVLFDLGNTLIKFPWDARAIGKEAGKEMSLFDKMVKVTFDSLVRSGIKIDWASFHEEYMSVRAEQLEWQKRTLREYDMYDRVSRTLNALGVESSPDSPAVRKAIDDHYASYMDYVEMERKVPLVLQDLHLKGRLGLITNFAHPPSIYNILEKFGLRKLFDVILVSREVGWVKPSPKIFEAALSFLRLKSSQCVFVGDDVEADIRGAKGVGMSAIFLGRKDSKCPEADAVIYHLAELQSAIQRLEE